MSIKRAPVPAALPTTLMRSQRNGGQHANAHGMLGKHVRTKSAGDDDLLNFFGIDLQVIHQDIDTCANRTFGEQDLVDILL